MLDYKGIIDNLEPEKVKSLLLQLGVEQIVEHAGYFSTNTICHNEEGGGLNLCYYYDTHLFHCFSEDGTFAIFKLLELYYATRGIEYDWYKDVYCVARDCSASIGEVFTQKEYLNLRERMGERRKEVPLPIYDAGVLKVFQKFYPPEWLNDGISKAAMDKYNILYSIPQNKIIIPHYDIRGNLVGIRGRALDPDEAELYGKYAPVWIERKMYNHQLSMNLYGINFNLENIKKKKVVVLAEGEKSVLQAEGFSSPNCTLAVCGSSFNKFQLNLLLRNCYPDEIVIAFDKEKVKDSYDAYFEKLWALGSKYKNYCNISFLYDRRDLLDFKDSPFDRGEEVFERLMKGRVKIR